jgi:hypothetical protein
VAFRYLSSRGLQIPFLSWPSYTFPLVAFIYLSSRGLHIPFLSWPTYLYRAPLGIHEQQTVRESVQEGEVCPRKPRNARGRRRRTRSFICDRKRARRMPLRSIGRRGGRGAPPHQEEGRERCPPASGGREGEVPPRGTEGKNETANERRVRHHTQVCSAQRKRDEHAPNTHRTRNDVVIECAQEVGGGEL